MNLENHQRRMNKKTLAIALVALSIVGTVALATTLAQATASQKISTQTFHDQMRKLWEDHITWTRLAIISIVNGLADTNATVDRLFQNQADIGNAIKPFYGHQAGDQLTALLHAHIAIAAEILIDAKAGNTTAMNVAITAWYANANSIAVFLTNANPKFWSLAMTTTMMKTHLDLTLNEAVAYLHGDYNGSVQAYDAVHMQILGMADMLSFGITAQFPGDFTGAR